MKKRIEMMNRLLAGLVLMAFLFVSCNANYAPSFKDSITDAQMKPVVSKVIDGQMKYIKDYLDDDLRERIDGMTKGSDLVGKDIVELTLEETGGRDYLDFCYAMNATQASDSPDAVLETAKSLLSKQDYEDLCARASDLTKSLEAKGMEMVAKGIPLDQQEAFYKDLKILITRAIVLLAAGIVYAAMPGVIFWGKVSAAAAISIGAGLVAISVMSIYEYCRFGSGDESEKEFDEWFKDVISIPKADFALTVSITTIAEAMELGPVPTGIIICVFAVYNVTNLVRKMMKTYNFDA